MVEFLDFPKARPTMVDEVTLVDRLERNRAGFRFTATALPGHTIQCIVRGRTHHQVSGRHYEVKRGMLLWFEEDESTEGEVLEAPWTFFTLNFHAPSLSAPPIDARVRRVGPRVFRQFERLLEVWRDTSVPSA